MSWDKPYKPLVALAWRYLQAALAWNESDKRQAVRGTCLAVSASGECKRNLPGGMHYVITTHAASSHTRRCGCCRDVDTHQPLAHSHARTLSHANGGTLSNVSGIILLRNRNGDP
jgi:hypothetical protein